MIEKSEKFFTIALILSCLSLIISIFLIKYDHLTEKYDIISLNLYLSVIYFISVAGYLFFNFLRKHKERSLLFKISIPVILFFSAIFIFKISYLDGSEFFLRPAFAVLFLGGIALAIVGGIWKGFKYVRKTLNK